MLLTPKTLWHRSASDWLLTLLLLILAIAPWHLGGNRPLSGAALASALGCLGLLTGLTLIAGQSRLRMPWDVALAMMLGLVAMLWAWLQALPIDALPWLPASWRHPVWDVLDGTSMAGAGAIAIHRTAPPESLMMLLAVLLTFWLAFLLSQRLHRARRLLGGIVLITTLYAALGLVMTLSGWRPFDEIGMHRLVTSTFANRNHYATYANLGFVVALALIFAAPQQGDDRLIRTRVRWQRAITTPIEKSPWRSMALGIGFVAVLGSQSRGGLVSLATALVLFAWLQHQGRWTSGRKTLATAVIFIGLATMVIALVGQPLLARFDDIGSETDLGVGGRLSAWSRTMELIALAPWQGYGLGTYENLFLMNLDERFTRLFDHAHNDYLELAAGLGIPAAGAVVLAGVILALRCARLTGTDDRHQRRFAMAGLLAAIAVAVHALVDFSLTIPAVAVTFAAILGAGCAQVAAPNRMET